MTTIIPAALSASRRILPAAVVASGLVLGLSPAVATAEWDIEAYDNCMKQPHGPATGNVWEEQYRYNCCVDSGGQWSDAQQKCVAPPMNAQEPGSATSSRPLPPGAVIPALPGNNLGGG
jgi:hypothetical protein